MDLLLYSYNKEVKYYFENIILRFCSLSKDVGNLKNEDIEQIIKYDNYFSENGFTNIFINILS